MSKKPRSKSSKTKRLLGLGGKDWNLIAPENTRHHSPEVLGHELHDSRPEKDRERQLRLLRTEEKEHILKKHTLIATITRVEVGNARVDGELLAGLVSETRLSHT